MKGEKLKESNAGVKAFYNRRYVYTYIPVPVPVPAPVPVIRICVPADYNGLSNFLCHHCGRWRANKVA